MSWMIIEGPAGRQVIGPGESHVFGEGETVVAVTPDKPESAESATEQVDKLARHFGMRAADFIEWATGVLGIPPCPKCQMSKAILYRMREIGWLRGLKLLAWIRFQELKKDG